MNKCLMLLVGCLLCVVVAEKTFAQIAYVTYYTPAPTYIAPAPIQVTSFYAPAPAVAYQRVPVARTRYRPLLGGTVTRYRTAYTPVVVSSMPMVYGY
ncbi:hypothetical protein [Bythopirellula goksoeyrii]|uniref:Uncharacterized protein n=1 Tax=Bythopirellula goksoeyrii TaxID=1400387 RepID=A0A5B9QR24_9BACT|nr:hypothetical protein [Bythopirellula goksoeyrii]QEG36581.1 hypothetical protein Pr1d_38950 [Bythopirellula goksoeyrii]